MKIIKNRHMQVRFTAGRISFFFGKKKEAVNEFALRYISQGQEYDTLKWEWHAELSSKTGMDITGRSISGDLTQKYRLELQKNKLVVSYSMHADASVSITDFAFDILSQGLYDDLGMDLLSAGFISDGHHAVHERLHADPQFAYFRSNDFKNILLVGDYLSSGLSPSASSSNGSDLLSLQKDSVVLEPGEHAQMGFTISSLNKRQLEKRLNVLRDEHTLINKKQSLFAYNKEYSWEVHKTNIFHGEGIFSVIRAGDDEYHSMRAPSEYEKISANSSRITYEHPFGTEMWQLDFYGDALRVNVRLDIRQDDFKIDDYQLCVLMDKRHKPVRLVTETGESPVSDTGVLRGKEEGVFYLGLGAGEEIFLRAGNSLSDASLYEIDLESYEEASLIKLHNLPNKENTYFTEIVIRDRSLLFQDVRVVGNSTYIQSDPSGLHLYHKRSGLLSALQGFHASYCLGEGEWIDSVHHAERRCFFKKDKGFLMSVEWKNIPLVQEWEVRCRKKDQYVLMITNIAEEDIAISNENFNMVFSPVYTDWRFSGGSGGSFQQVDAGGDSWVFLYKTEQSNRELVLSGNGIAGTSLSFIPGVFDLTYQIMNSPAQFDARMVQCCREGKLLIPKGKHECLQVNVSCG